MTATGLAQQTLPAKIDVNTDIDLTKVYEQYVKEGYGTPAIYEKLANGNYFKNNYAQAKKWYEKLFETQADPNTTLQFRYQQTLKALSAQRAKKEALLTSIE
ncbi:MAG: hypothetical protein CMC08_09065 [Flavobacteriaceae bacterium]|nr:hypothetical protein [Flavobacteriaceae bacterium]